ncbi:MAG: phosphotransferase [Chitinophagaceae bacterium]|nr:phosphotransferase [Chitinophagaceae bacterium]MBK7305669.1 phosphotransferase [Chitinophagaceae bacterium]MBK9484282.1 phosphotransferase [Chitinophagaceae bacterium]MBL0198887.1 phosphotransferase [Chitinophagaceae bacterium]
MHSTTDKIKELFAAFSKAEITAIDKLPQAGSERHYFRIHTADKTFIATYGANLKENDSFIYFSKHFKKKNLQVPEILCINDEKNIYLQEDFGDISLLNRLEENGFTTNVYDLYKKSLQQLALLQVKGHEGLDYKKCLTNSSFGKQAIMADLLYFKYYFLDALRQPYDKQKLIDDFEALSNYLSHTEYKYFMFRDFQSRNIMVTPEDDVHFIDYQGGMKGAPQYDVASLLWQAKANLPDEWKQHLLEDYMEAFERVVEEPIDKDIFRSQYNGYVLIRLLQVLGAYGFRGLFERKAHFLTSIPLALQNLKWFVQNQSLGIAVPEFKKVLELCISDEVIQEFTPVQATDQTPLLVTINSFSFIKTGYPKDETKNGGGFVFDMRGILNPGRFDEYKHLSGLDKPVKDFLEQQTKMPDFLNGVYSIIDISVEDYIKRGFENLSVNFGCTGGQHRSVYAAEAIARHLRNKFKVKIQLSHTNKENWVR